MVFGVNIFVEVFVLTEHVHIYESASYDQHTTRVFTLKQNPSILSGEQEGERKSRKREYSVSCVENTGRMGVKVRRMGVNGLTHVTISLVLEKYCLSFAY